MKKFTHPNATVEALGTHGNNNILTYTFEHLRAADNKAVSMRRDIFFAHDLLIGDFFDGIGLSCRSGLVTFDVMARQKDTIARYYFTRLQQSNIPDDNFL
jgi:hypothetical protein